jgi:hypothetical protein
VVIFDDNEYHYHEAPSYRKAYDRAVDELRRWPNVAKASIRRVKGDMQEERKVIYMKVVCTHQPIGPDGICRRCGKDMR